MNPFCFVCVPSRFSALFVLRLLALLFPVSLWLLALPAQAGTWSFAVTSWTYSRTLNGVTYGTLKPRNYGYEIGVGGGSDNFSTTAQADEDLTITATWHADPNIVGDKVPPSTILKIQTSASSNGNVNGSTAAGTDVHDGFDDPIDSTGTSKGTHYRVEVGDRFQFSLTLHASYTNPSGAAIAAVGGVSFSIVSGNWVGPYYFHHGYYRNNSHADRTLTPWANNTANETPSITDTPDDTSSFYNESASNTNDVADLDGSITPVWYWDGPDLGVAPPPFLISLNAEATCNDFNATLFSHGTQDVYNQLNEDQPQRNTTTMLSTGYDTVFTTVQSDVYVPGQGNGYWAIGPSTSLGAFVSGNGAPYNLESNISLSAQIIDGKNGY